MPSSTRHALDHLQDATRDSEGRLLIGNPQRGCPHCGEIAIKYGKHNDTILHHPALECCEKRLTQEIAWRTEEIQKLQREAATEEETTKGIRASIEEMDTQARRKAAQARAEHAERNLERRKREHYNPGISSLAREIARLRAKLREVTP